MIYLYSSTDTYKVYICYLLNVSLYTFGAAMVSYNQQFEVMEANTTWWKKGWRRDNYLLIPYHAGVLTDQETDSQTSNKTIN